MSARVADNRDESRYEVYSGDRRAGHSAYAIEGDAMTILHTDIDDRFQGQGLGSELASRMLEDARERRLDVLPYCPFVQEYIAAHPRYAELVPPSRRAEFGLAGA